MVVSCGVKNACESSPDESYLTCNRKNRMSLITLTIYIFHFDIAIKLPSKLLGLIGWVDEVVVRVVRKLGCTIQVSNAVTSANVQEQPA